MMRSKSKYNCVIIDNDEKGIELLKTYVCAVPKLSLLRTFSNPRDALIQIKNAKKIDFLFLDINMEISGLEIARMLRDDIRFIVFVTANSEYALDAFSVNADRYLLKPVSFQTFLKTVNELQIRHARMNH